MQKNILSIRVRLKKYLYVTCIKEIISQISNIKLSKIIHSNILFQKQNIDVIIVKWHRKFFIQELKSNEVVFL